jgi:hypothetical protein
MLKKSAKLSAGLTRQLTRPTRKAQLRLRHDSFFDDHVYALGQVHEADEPCLSLSSPRLRGLLACGNVLANLARVVITGWHLVSALNQTSSGKLLWRLRRQQK